VQNGNGGYAKKYIKRTTLINQKNLLRPTVLNSKLQQFMTPIPNSLITNDIASQAMKIKNLSKEDRDKMMN